MLTLEHLGQNEWRFQTDLSDDQLSDTFYDTLDLMNEGKLDAAANNLRSILRISPEHIDAWHHLALILEDKGDDLLAWACIREAVRLGLAALPKKFCWGHRLEWGFLENRPFLRAYYALGLRLFQRQDLNVAQEIFTQLLSVNPNDNQGARYMLLACLLASENWKEARQLIHRHKDEVSPDMSYAEVLVLLAFGEENKAEKCLHSAVEQHPKVARELLKSRHIRPKSCFPGTITVGGDDEAFDYWERNKAYWAKDTRAYALLKQVGHTLKI